MSRDFVAEMRAVIDAEATGTYVPGVVAVHIVEKLRETDPELLSGWLDGQAEAFVRQAINNRDNSQRTAARHSRPRSVFAADAEAAEAGEPERLTGWLSTRFTVEDGSRKPLAEMAKDDLLFDLDVRRAAGHRREPVAGLRPVRGHSLGQSRVNLSTRPPNQPPTAPPPSGPPPPAPPPKSANSPARQFASPQIAGGPVSPVPGGEGPGCKARGDGAVVVGTGRAGGGSSSAYSAGAATP